MLPFGICLWSLAGAMLDDPWLFVLVSVDAWVPVPVLVYDVDVFGPGNSEYGWLVTGREDTPSL